MPRIFATTLAFLALSACATMNPVTLYKLSRLSPLDADPGDFTVAIDVPQGLGIAPGTARLSMRATRKGQKVGDSFALARIPAQSGDLPTPKGHYILFRVADSDLPAIRAIQATARDWETRDPSGTQGSLSADLLPCTIDDGPTGAPKASIYLQLEPGGGFLPLARVAVKIRGIR